MKNLWLLFLLSGILGCGQSHLTSNIASINRESMIYFDNSYKTVFNIYGDYSRADEETKYKKESIETIVRLIEEYGIDQAKGFLKKVQAVTKDRARASHILRIEKVESFRFVASSHSRDECLIRVFVTIYTKMMDIAGRAEGAHDGKEDNWGCSKQKSGFDPSFSIALDRALSGNDL